jgi:tRNA-splicing ligase RtcB (3'-phosphate/5'-hydroxy nucleic acid ligase)
MFTIGGKMKIQGKYNNAICFTDNIEYEAIEQIKRLLGQKWIENEKVRIMPDVHAGAGCTIGTTMTISDKIIPNLVGVDISCGVEVVKLKEKELDLKRLDEVIHNYVPSGFNVRNKPHKFMSQINLEDLRCFRDLKDSEISRAKLSLASLGGGNHYVELDKDNDENIYLVIHTGSRNIGKCIALLYQRKAIEECKGTGIQNDLAYVSGKSFDDYLYDMSIMQKYAELNRKGIVDVILTGIRAEKESEFTTVHNYIDLKNNILRKGAVSAQANEELIIPINMRDGALLCRGKNNSLWNFSAPHGAGRLMSRGNAKRSISMEDYIKSMNGIYSTTINAGTIDESPMAYKSIEEIKRNIVDSVDIIKQIRPIYNFKASE